MDPEEALARLRAWAEQAEDDSAAEAFTALDEWISRGGFLPADWRRDGGPLPEGRSR